MWGLKHPGEPDEIDRKIFDMIERISRDEIVPFDEFEDLREEIEEELENASVPEDGLSLEEALTLARANKKQFLSSLKRLGLSLENRYELCYDMMQRAYNNPSEELLRVFCDIVSDNEYLLNYDPTLFSEEEYMEFWCDAKSDSDELFEYLQGQIELSKQYEALLEQAKSKILPQVEITTGLLNERDKIFQIYTKLYQIDDNSPIFDNITYLLQLANSSKALTILKPLFLCQVFIKHEKRIQNNRDFCFNFKSLWNYHAYQIDKDNGKNYNTYSRYCELFRQLCEILQYSSDVDISLCACGFDRLSNLGIFYRNSLYTFYLYNIETEPNIGYQIPFAKTAEDLMMFSSFSCFKDNIILQESNITQRQLDNFQISKENHIFYALKQISNYMNENIGELIIRFFCIKQEHEAVKTLCRDVLEASKLPHKYQPKTVKETALFLAAINGTLIETVNGYVHDFLEQTIRAFTGEPEQ